MARPLTHVDERQGRWMPAYYQADELPYNVPGPRGEDISVLQVIF